jgi:hypothetical protein
MILAEVISFHFYSKIWRKKTMSVVRSAAPPYIIKPEEKETKDLKEGGSSLTPVNSGGGARPINNGLTNENYFGALHQKPSCQVPSSSDSGILNEQAVHEHTVTKDTSCRDDTTQQNFSQESEITDWKQVFRNPYEKDEILRAINVVQESLFTESVAP